MCDGGVCPEKQGIRPEMSLICNKSSSSVLRSASYKITWRLAGGKTCSPVTQWNRDWSFSAHFPQLNMFLSAGVNGDLQSLQGWAGAFTWSIAFILTRKYNDVKRFCYQILLKLALWEAVSILDEASSAKYNQALFDWKQVYTIAVISWRCALIIKCCVR